MKFLTVFFVLFLPLTLLASDKFYPSVGVTNMVINYNGIEGNGSVEKAKYHVSKMVEITHDKLDFSVSTPNKKIVFKDVENSVAIDTGFDLSFLFAANLGIESAFFDAEQASLKSAEGEVFLKKQRIRYKNLRVDTDFKLIKRRINELPITEGNIYFSNLNLQMSKAIKDLVSDIMKGSKSLGFLEELLKTEYYNLFSGGIHLKNGRFYGQAWLDKLINIKIKFDSQITLENNDKLLVIQVNKIKASLVSIKGKVLKAIQNANIKNVRVDGSKILINL